MDDSDSTRAPPKLFYSKLPFEQAVIPQVLKLWNTKQYEQRTEEWYKAREGLLSASDAADALRLDDDCCDEYIRQFDLQGKFCKEPKKCTNKYGSELKLILKKCNLGEPFTSNMHTEWGQKYETVVANVYSQMRQTDVLEFGLLPHPTISFIGASPDGITVDGTMLEIKCPSVRAVGPVPPIWYWVQMQVQMAVAGCSQCDFFDAKIVEMIIEEEWLEEARAHESCHPEALHHTYGIILHMPEDADHKFRYAPLDVVKVDQFLEWADSDENCLLQRTYYKLHEYYISRVLASDDWFRRNLPKFEALWNKILHGRTPQGLQDLKDGIEKRKRKKKEPESKVVQILDPKRVTIPLLFDPSEMVTKTVETVVTETVEMTETIQTNDTVTSKMVQTETCRQSVQYESGNCHGRHTICLL